MLAILSATPRMHLRRLPPRLALCTALLAGGAAAQDVEAEAPVAVRVPEKPEAQWEGAIGMIATYRPEYQGATERIVNLKPVIFVRYGRFTASSGGSGFATRRPGDIARGLGLNIVDSERVRLSLGLRYDGGRSAEDSGALAGMGDIKATVRVRAAASWRFDSPWRLGANWSIDAFGRGGGHYGEVNATYEKHVAPKSILTLGGSLGMGGGTYMQAYYGVTEEQSAASGYPVYTASAGLREIAFAAGLRHEFNDEWTFLAGAGVSRLLGSAAASPLTLSPTGWGINTGAVWRF